MNPPLLQRPEAEPHRGWGRGGGHHWSLWPGSWLGAGHVEVTGSEGRLRDSMEQRSHEVFVILCVAAVKLAIVSQVILHLGLQAPAGHHGLLLLLAFTLLGARGKAHISCGTKSHSTHTETHRTDQ